MLNGLASGNTDGSSTTSVEKFHYIGGSGSDKITAGTGDDFLDGRGGNDTLKGGDGNDTIYGGGTDAGKDTILGGDGEDWLFGQGGNDKISGDTGNDYIDGGDGNDTLSGGNGADTMYGGNGNDVMIGARGDDYIQGGAGEDTLDGGAGDDTLFGGGGVDKFKFTTTLSAIDNIDTIQDFAVADDLIQIDHKVFSGGGLALGALAANQFVIAAAAMDGKDRIIYNNATGALYYDADGNGGGGQVQFAKVSTGLAMTHNNIVVI